MLQNGVVEKTYKVYKIENIITKDALILEKEEITKVKDQSLNCTHIEVCPLLGRTLSDERKWKTYDY